MKTVRDILGGKPHAVITTAPTDTVYDALVAMARHDIGALVVLDGFKPAGMFTERDYARKVALLGRVSRDVSVADVMTPAAIVRSADTVETCMAIMTECRVRHLAVCEGGTVIGVVSIGDIVKAMLDEQRFTIERLEHYIVS